MAIKVDAARPQDEDIVCAMNAFTQPTPRTMERLFNVWTSEAETHIPSLTVSVTPVDNTGDLSAPAVDYESEPFWLSKVVKTVRI
jgi:hypothetical protein